MSFSHNLYYFSHKITQVSVKHRLTPEPYFFLKHPLFIMCYVGNHLLFYKDLAVAMDCLLWLLSTTRISQKRNEPKTTLMYQVPLLYCFNTQSWIIHSNFYYIFSHWSFSALYIVNLYNNWKLLSLLYKLYIFSI